MYRRPGGDLVRRRGERGKSADPSAGKGAAGVLSICTMSLPAKYDPNRVPTGQFAKGNRASRDHSNRLMQRLQDLQELWYGASSVDDMQMVKAELLKLCRQDENLDVKLKSCIYVTDRTLGKVPDRVDMNVSQEDAGWRADRLSSDDLALWEGLVKKALTDPAPEIVVIPAESQP